MAICNEFREKQVNGVYVMDGYPSLVGEKAIVALKSLLWLLLGKAQTVCEILEVL